jgi:hypothetical protein
LKLLSEATSKAEVIRIALLIAAMVKEFQQAADAQVKERERRKEKKETKERNNNVYSFFIRQASVAIQCLDRT